MDRDDIERAAEELYREVDLDPSDPAPVAKIARLWPVIEQVDLVPNLVGAPAMSYKLHGKIRIALRKSVPLEYRKFFLGHELGHVVLERAGYVGEDLEEACDAFGAALIAPRPAVARMQRAFGLDLVAYAEAVGATQTWATLRVGEVLRTPLAAISPEHVRVRGPENWVWPDERTLRGWASGRTRPGIRKVRLTDQPKRVALLAEDEDASEVA